MFVDDLSVILGFVGATGSVSISFILPSVYCKPTFFLLKSPISTCNTLSVISLFKDSTSRRDRQLRVAAALLLVWGVVVMIISLGLQFCELPFLRCYRRLLTHDWGIQGTSSVRKMRTRCRA